MRPTLEILNAVSHKLKSCEEQGCHNFIGYKSQGYGQFQFRFAGNKYNIHAHRAVYIILHQEELVTEDVIMHLCDNPSCINPEHLKKGSHNDNVADRVAKGRSASGKRNGRYTHGRYCK